MTTLTLEKQTIKKTHFLNLKELFDYAIDNQIISELWTMNKSNLSDKNKILFEKSKNTSDLINI